MKKTFKYIMGLALWSVLLLPLASYIYKFGYCIWEKPEGWSNFGTAMSGIYSPIIAFLAFIIIVAQVIAQSKMNKHQHDQAYISQNLSDLNFYIDLLDKELDKRTENNLTVREELQSVFGYLENEAINEENVKTFAKEFNLKYKKVFDYWGAIYPLLMSLGSQKEYPYEHNFVGSKQRIISVLSFLTCVALDQFHSCITENRTVKEYYFLRNGS